MSNGTKVYSAGEMMTALCVWEAMLAMRLGAERDGTDIESPMMAVWGDAGAYEMRDRATEIAVWIESLFGDSDAGDMSHPMRALCDAESFDWEIIPAILDMLQWDAERLSWSKPDNVVARLQAKFAIGD